VMFEQQLRRLERAMRGLAHALTPALEGVSSKVM
jgi:hypothetical protein